MEQIDLIKTLDEILYGMAFKDIERASAGNSKIGAFILASCFIDVLARYRYGAYNKNGKNILRERKKTFCFYSKKTISSSKLYVNFVKEYLPQYKANDLYKSLRCGLVHAYVEGGKYLFTDKNQAGQHFDKLNDKILLNLENFINDVESAYKRLIYDIKSNAEIFENAKFKLTKEGTLMILKVRIPTN